MNNHLPDRIAYRSLKGEECLSVFAMVKMSASPKKRTELLQTLETLKDSTSKAELGCIGYRFFQEGKNENSIILILELQSQEKLTAFQNSDQYKILLGALSLLCESSEIIIGSGELEAPS